MKRNRMADCHPKRKHYARGKCAECYSLHCRPLTKAARDAQPGLVRVGVPGWGCVA